MTINFGVIPVRTTFTLSSDAPFYQAARTSDGSNFPVGASLVIKWLDAANAVITTYTATIALNVATWNVVAATVATLLTSNPAQGRVFYSDGASIVGLLLAQGDIIDKSP